MLLLGDRADRVPAGAHQICAVVDFSLNP